MLSKEYLDTARTLLRVARNMTDQTIANRLKALAADYERRAEQASHADAARPRPWVPARPEFAEKWTRRVPAQPPAGRGSELLRNSTSGRRLPRVGSLQRG